MTTFLAVLWVSYKGNFRAGEFGFLLLQDCSSVGVSPAFLGSVPALIMAPRRAERSTLPRVYLRSTTNIQVRPYLPVCADNRRRSRAISLNASASR